MMMQFSELLANAGEHSFWFEGAGGQGNKTALMLELPSPRAREEGNNEGSYLEGRLLVPQDVSHSTIALLGHPHSLQGGTMNNKVVTTMARAFAALGIPSLRFNFRGVGASEGVFDNGIGESDDMLLLAALWKNAYPNSRFIFAGFSFGSYVTYRAASQCPHELLISIAPPVSRYDYTEFSPGSAPWHILQGDEDELVDLQEILDFVDGSTAVFLHRFPETSHFFHGKLVELKAVLMDIIKKTGLSV